MEGIRIVERELDPDIYAAFRTAVGWQTVAAEGVERGLAASLFSVVAETADGEVIGCGRIVGDGGIYFYVQDIIVLPTHQGRGVGTAIMDAVMTYLDTHASSGSFVGLMAADGVAGFYRRYGFRERPDEQPGMYRRWG